MDSNMRKNNFQQLAQNQDPPQGMKEKVMSSAKASYIMLYTMDLFINKPIELLGVLLKNGKHHE